MKEEPPKTLRSSCARCAGHGQRDRINPDWLIWRRGTVARAAIAQAAGVDPSFIARVENGERLCTSRLLEVYEGL